METLSWNAVKKNHLQIAPTTLIQLSAFLIRGDNFMHAQQENKHQ